MLGYLCTRRVSLLRAQGQPNPSAWFGNTPFEHPFSHNTPHQPHPELEC